MLKIRILLLQTALFCNHNNFSIQKQNVFNSLIGPTSWETDLFYISALYELFQSFSFLAVGRFWFIAEWLFSSKNYFSSLLRQTSWETYLRYFSTQNFFFLPWHDLVLSLKGVLGTKKTVSAHNDIKYSFTDQKHNLE